MKQLTFLYLMFLWPLCMLSAQQCTVDCVWPGDLNANGIANNIDILSLGFSWEQTGPTRSNTSSDWEAMNATDWGLSLPGSGVDLKHCDSNGDGIIDRNDQFPISINYNRTNDQFTGLLGNNFIGNDLFLVPQNRNTSPSDTFFLDIHLGSDSNPITDLYGIAFQLKIDTQYVAAVNFDFSESWIGTGNEVFTYGKFNNELDHAATAITRLDGTTASGFGKIARLEIVITDVVLGLVIDTSACIPFPLTFENVLGINEFEEDLMITSVGDSLNLKDRSQLTTSHSDILIEDHYVVFPNPTRGQLYIHNSKHYQLIEEYKIYTQLGQLIKQNNSSNPIGNDEFLMINLEGLQEGIYFLEIRNKNTSIIKKILLQE